MICRGEGIKFTLLHIKTAKSQQSKLNNCRYIATMPMAQFVVNRWFFVLSYNSRLNFVIKTKRQEANQGSRNLYHTLYLKAIG